jgi:hypothetical protein
VGLTSLWSVRLELVLFLFLFSSLKSTTDNLHPTTYNLFLYTTSSPITTYNMGFGMGIESVSANRLSLSALLHKGVV